MFIIQHEIAENRELKKQLVEAQKVADEIKAKEALKNNPPVAREGYKMVPHDDHWHEVPIDAPDTWEEAQIADTSDDTQQPIAEVDYPNPDNPVQALREYLEKQGHWSAKHIPDFPPEDTEAAQMARNILIMLAHEDAGNEILDGPAEPANREFLQTLEHYKFIYTQRGSDIYKLSWATLDEPFPDSVINEFNPPVEDATKD